MISIIDDLNKMLYSHPVAGEFFIVDMPDHIYIIFTNTNEAHECKKIINIIRDPKYNTLRNSMLDIISDYIVAVVTHKKEVFLINNSAFEKKYGECFKKNQFKIYRIGIKKQMNFPSFYPTPKNNCSNSNLTM